MIQRDLQGSEPTQARLASRTDVSTRCEDPANSRGSEIWLAGRSLGRFPSLAERECRLQPYSPPFLTNTRTIEQASR